MSYIFQFIFYIFILGMLTLILDSCASPIEKPFKYEDRFLLCHFNQIHLPKHATEIAKFNRDKKRKYLLVKSLTKKSKKKYVVQFFLENTNSESNN